MRGLTADERRMLVDMAALLNATGPSGPLHSDEEEEVANDLISVGRAFKTELEDCYWLRITPAGLQALAIDAALRALGAA